MRSRDDCPKHESTCPFLPHHLLFQSLPLFVFSMLYVSLGSNLSSAFGSKSGNISRALQLLEERVGHVVSRSADLQTAPVGFQSDNQFINAAACIDSTLSAEEVLCLTQQIEREMGRTAKSRDGVYADRIIDIDLLFIDGVTLESPQLTLPHPHLAERDFVLRPLAEIASDLLIPTLGKTVGTLYDELRRNTIGRLEFVRNDELQIINRLLSQLSSHAQPLDKERLEELVADNGNGTSITVVRDGEGRIAGMATLCVCHMPTGCKAWIEDVVVDGACRGQGYGRRLVEKLVEEARRLGASSVNLTSRPEREAANALYRSIGFVQRSTNVYRLSLH